MADINSYYSPGAMHTDTSGGPVGGMGGDGSGFFMEMARRKQAQQDQLAQNAQELHGLQMQSMRRAMVPPAQQERHFDMRSELLKNAQMDDQTLQMQARQNPQPMKLTTVGQQTFYSPDTNAMNAYQRQAYLPNNSQIVSNGSPVATGSIEPVDGSPGARAAAESDYGGGGPLTPSSASGSPLRRQLSQQEQAQQQMTNSRYGR